MNIFSPQQEELIRKEFAHLSTNYFNAANFGPTPYRAKQKVANALFKELDPSFFSYHTWVGIPDRIRKKIAQIFNFPLNAVALGTSTTDFVSQIANHFPIPEGAKTLNVVSLNGDYPSNILPWMVAAEYRKNLNFSLLKAPEATQEQFSLNWLQKNLPEQCHVLIFSLVQFDSGRKVDLLEIAKFLKEKNIFVIVDATQFLGGQFLNEAELQVVDVLICSSYKWMLGPYGQAFAVFSEKALQILPRSTGSWLVSTNSKEVQSLTNYTTSCLAGARKFDRGQSPNMLANACFEAALEILEELELKNIQQYNHLLRDYFLVQFPKNKFELVTPENKNYQACILSLISKTKDLTELETELKHHNIDMSIRQGKLRLSFHFMNTKKQIDNLLNVLDT